MAPGSGTVFNPISARGAPAALVGPAVLLLARTRGVGSQRLRAGTAALLAGCVALTVLVDGQSGWSTAAVQSTTATDVSAHVTPLAAYVLAVALLASAAVPPSCPRRTRGRTDRSSLAEGSFDDVAASVGTASKPTGAATA
jgi:hypothetical protein